MIRHLCILNFTRMGDLIQCGPLLHSYREAYPDAQITLVVLENFRSTAERLPMVDKVIGFDLDHFEPLLASNRNDFASAFRELNNFLSEANLKSVDLLINLSHTALSATIVSLINARQVIGMYRHPDGQLSVSSDWINYLLSLMQDRRLNPYNLVEINLRLGPPLRSTPELFFRVGEEDRREAEQLLTNHGVRMNQPLMVLQAGASSEHRRWPVARFAELSRALDSQGYQVILVGSKDECGLANEIVSRSGESAVSLAGLTTVGTLAAILESARKLVSNDTGTIHLSAAVKTPTIGIYLGPASAKDTAPYGNGHIIIEADLDCAPCSYQTVCDHYICREQISVKDVLMLCLAEKTDLRMVAGRMKGSRIYETCVNRSGEFSLTGLNKYSETSAGKLLSGYRIFWDHLLSWSGSKHLQESMKDFQDPQRVREIEELQSIYVRAAACFNELVHECTRVNGNDEVVESLLSKQLDWQNEIRRFINKHSLMTSFPQLLLVRLTTLRSIRLEDYLHDMSETLKLFGRGLEVLLSGLKYQTKTVTNYARCEENTCS